MKVSLLQMDLALGQVTENAGKAWEMLHRALEQGTEVAVLPELWTTGYDLERIHELAEEEASSPTLARFAALAREKGLALVLGSLPEKDCGRIYNTSWVLGPEGRVVGKYRKVHLFAPMGEPGYLSPGKELSTFELGGARCGLMICYDLRFPELCRALALRGATVIFVPSEFPKPRLHHWRTLLQARAIENQLFVVAVNRIGEDNANGFFGHSMVVDPWGEVLFEAGEEEGVWTVELDLARVEEVRRRIPCLRDRVPAVYGGLKQGRSRK